MHGFLNVLVATTLAASHDLTLREIQEILACRDAKAFSFNSSGLSWGEHRATIEQIETGRDIFRAFGSCSVSEPIEDLTRRGLVGSEVATAASKG